MEQAQPTKRRIKKQKVSLYLNPERAAMLDQVMQKSPSSVSLQEAIYQVIDWWAMDAGYKPPTVSCEELSDIRRLLAHSVATQETMAAKTAEALVQLSKAIGSASVESAHALTKPAFCLPLTVSAKADKRDPPRQAYGTLWAWLLDTLTRVSAPKATKLLAIMKPMPSTEPQQHHYMKVELMNVEGAILSENLGSALALSAFEQPLNPSVPMYLVCQKTDTNTWRALVREVVDGGKYGKHLLSQEIKG